MASPHRHYATPPDQAACGSADQTAQRATDTTALTALKTLQEARAVLRQNIAELRGLNQAMRHRIANLRTLVRRRPDIQSTYERQAAWVTAMSTLAAGIAHELNNPLNTILMNTEEARALYHATEGSVEHDMEQALQDIAHETQRCAKIIKSLLRLVRSAPSAKEPADLNAVVQHTMRHIERADYPATVRLHYVLAPHLPPLMLNPADIEQILLELVANAVMAIAQKGRIIIRTMADEDTVHLRVEDNGPGIPAEQLQHIFDPFHSTRRHQGGLGLGLSFVHGVVTDHQGTIRLYSISGEGTTVDITFLAVAQGEPQRDQDPAG